MSTIAAALCAFLFVLALVFSRAKVAVQRYVRRVAAEKLTDQALRAKIDLQDKDRDVRRAAVNELTDQALLARIAMKGKDWDLRSAATNKLTDQTLLAKIAVEGKHWPWRLDAVKKLTDQALLAKIAVEDEERYVRRHAVEKLTDQALLAKIAAQDKEKYVRRAAAHELTDKALWAKIVVNELLTRSLERDDYDYSLVSECKDLEKLLHTSRSMLSTSSLETILRLDISIDYFEDQSGGMGSPDRQIDSTYTGDFLKESARKELDRRSSLMAAPLTPANFCTVCGVSLLADPQHFCPGGSLQVQHDNKA
jgi:hypothetical protein